MQKRKRTAQPRKEYCCITETIEQGDYDSNTPYAQSFNLNEFYRASQVAPNFKFYRAKSVTYTYQPLYNTFQQNASVASVGAPYLYISMNRTQDSAYQNTPGGQAKLVIQAMGAVGRRFTTTQTLKYVPNWCSPGLVGIITGAGQVNNGYTMGMKVQKGWIASPNTNTYGSLVAQRLILDSTNAQPLSSQLVNDIPAVMYNGHNFFVDQDNNPTVPVCRCVVTVEWEFKGPNLVIGNPGAKPPVEEVPVVPT